MRSIHVILLGCVLSAPVPVMAQSDTPVIAADTALTDSVVEGPKKKGMFGKVKGLAKNKVVRQVAKTALCTAVPGGQVIAGAIDAAETKDVGGAAATAATGGGANCMPGMPGMGGQGMAGEGTGGATPIPGAAGLGMPGQPVTGMPGLAISPEQMAQMQEQYKSMGMDPAQVQAMMGGATGGASLAAGPSLVTEKGRLVLRDLPWVQGSAQVLEGSEDAFGQAVGELAQAILATSDAYRIEAKVEDQGGKKESKLLSSNRANVLRAALSVEGVPAERLETADGGSDKNPRIVVSKAK